MFIRDNKKDFVREDVQPNGTCLRESMIFRQCDYEICGADAVLFQAFGFGFKGESNEASIEKTGRQSFALLRGGHVEEIHRDGRVERAELLQSLWNGGVKEAPDVSDVNGCLLSGTGALHRAFALLKNGFRFGEERSAARGESDLAV